MLFSDLIIERNSHAKLSQPAPDGEDLAFIKQAALSAPDHARLRPWRFLQIDGEGRNALGQSFVEVAQAKGVTDAAKLEKLAANPLRAPMIIVLVAKQIDHAKVPLIEQVASAACCGQNILLAAQARGFGAMWRTGEMAFDVHIHRKLGLANDEVLLGYIYVGTMVGEPKRRIALEVDDYWQQWP